MNDNQPVFETSAYVATVMEGLPVGTRVVQVRALDPDRGSNGQVATPPVTLHRSRQVKGQSFSVAAFCLLRHQVTYSLDPDPPAGSRSPASSPSDAAAPSAASVFAIDGETGWITTAAPLDHESRSAYSLWAVASDRGQPRPLSATAAVTVDVGDVNDSPPRFEREVFRAAVSESDPPGAPVAVLATRDADGARRNRVISCYITGEARSSSPLPPLLPTPPRSI